MFQKLIDSNLATTGNNWNPPNYLDYRRFNEYDDGFLTNLYHGLAVTANTGLKQFEDSLTSLIGYNGFQVVNQFYTSHIFSEDPPIVPRKEDTPELVAWLDDHHDSIIRTLRQSIQQRVSKGKWCIVVRRDLDTNELYSEAIPSEYHWPIELDRTTGRVKSHLLAFEQRAPLITNAFEGYRTTTDNPNQITFVRFKKDSFNTSVTHEFTGRIIGNTISQSFNTDIEAIFTDGVGFADSFYQKIEDPMRRMLLALNAWNKIIHRNASPHLQQPPGNTYGSLDEIDAAGDLLSIDDPTVKIPWKYVELTGNLDYVEKFIQLMQSLMHQAIAIPPAVFGNVVGGRNESGTARLILTKASSGVIQSMRRSINFILNDLIHAMGAPEGDVYINWVTDPFETATEQATTIIQLVQAGIMSPQEGRDRLKLGAMPTELLTSVTPPAESRLTSGEMQESGGMQQTNGGLQPPVPVREK